MKNIVAGSEWRLSGCQRVVVVVGWNETCLDGFHPSGCVELKYKDGGYASGCLDPLILPNVATRMDAAMDLARGVLPARHDFTDPYCAAIIRTMTHLREPVPRCKHCGHWLGTLGPCVPEPRWRERADALTQAGQVTRTPAPPPTYAAPELRAASTWSCGLVRTRR